ncbi:MAG: hypothetical protein K1X87_01205 [Dehalococcoidia bacterium]|nr:hypothetical protein [Dehalococcoidia bacterium]
MPYLTRQYGSNARWLTKALREVPHEIHELLTSMDESELRWRPEDGDWCAKEVAAFLLESEREDLRAVEAILRRDGAPIEERRAYLAPGEHDYLDESIDELVWDFMTERESLLWSLEWSDAWEHAGEHPYRGRVPLLQYLHEINERDLEAAWLLRKLQEALGAGAVRRR